MGPNEQKLAALAALRKGPLANAATGWRTGSEGLNEVVSLLDVFAQDLETAWPDQAGAAATSQVRLLSVKVGERATDMLQGEVALASAEEAITGAVGDFSAVQGMSAPAEPGANAPAPKREAYNDDVAAYQAQREAKAAAAIKAYDQQLLVASGELHGVAPDARETKYRTETGGPSSSGTGYDPSLSPYGGAGGGGGVHVAPIAASTAGSAGWDPAGSGYGGYAASADGDVHGTIGGSGSSGSSGGGQSGLVSGAPGGAHGGSSAGMAGMVGGAAGALGGALGVGGSLAAGKGGSTGRVGAVGGMTASSKAAAASSGVLGKSGSASSAGGAGGAAGGRGGSMMPGSSGGGAAGGSSAGGRGGSGGMYSSAPNSGTGSGSAGGRGASSGMGAGSRAGVGGMAGGHGAASGRDDNKDNRRSGLEFEDDWLDDEEAGQGVLD